jgi:Xaa-Pro aminopeptidase
MSNRNGKSPTIGSSHYRARRARFLEKLEPNSVAIFVSNPERTRSNDTEFKYRQSSDILYLTGFPEPESVVVLTNIKGQPKFTLLVRPKDREREIWTGIRAGVEGAKSVYLADDAQTIDKFDELVGKLLKEAKHVYYKYDRNPEFDEKFGKVWTRAQKALLNPEALLHELRLFKTPEEVKIMRHAGVISAAAHCAAMRVCRPGMREYQLQSVLESVFTFNGADAPAYGSIVANGNNAVVLHYTENRDELKDGDLVLIDAAAEYAGYASDITRTFPVNGKFSEPQREIYELVLKAQLAAIEAARPGVKLADIHDTATRVMRRGLVKLGILPAASKSSKKKSKESLALGDFYMHGTSHWIGIDVHDVGSYATADGTRTDKGKGKQRRLEPGMCFTVEPGLYFDKDDDRVPKRYRGIGVRIEDDILITEDGYRVLTEGVPKTVEEIEELMADSRPYSLTEPVLAR